MPSRAPAAVDALLAALRASPGLSGVPVHDGPEASGDYQDSVFVGYDGDPDGEGEAVLTDQEWAGIGAKKRDETISIICCVVAISGEGESKISRDRVFGLFSAVEDELRANPSLSQSPPFIMEVQSPRLLWDWVSTAGLQARLVFTVSIRARI